MKKPNIKLNIRITLGVFVFLFVILGGYLAYTVGKYGNTWFSMPYNPRIAAANESIDVGTVYDRNGIRLAWSEDGVRHYAENGDTRRSVAHVLGDTKGKTMGAQSYYANYLYGYDKSAFKRLALVFSGEKMSGSDIKLTIDADLSTYIYNHMDYDGAVVVLDTKTGEILASVSKPSFDAENLPTEELDEQEGSEYVNRATMGKYPPGSTMKIITATAALETGINFSYDCTGSQNIEGQDITCPEAGGHGNMDLQNAFKDSCNTYFGVLSTKLGKDTLMRYAKKFLYNTEFEFSDFSLYSSQFEGSDNSGDIAWAGIGQYKDLITPMHNAMIATAIANDGKMLEPKLLLDVLHGETSVYQYSKNILATVAHNDTIEKIKEFMNDTVENGTATSAQIPGYMVCGKTGTAEYNEDGETKNHSWFVGFVDDEEHAIAISVILEGAGYGSAHAAPLAEDVLSYAIDLGY